jgi:hypothetical protein
VNLRQLAIAVRVPGKLLDEGQLQTPGRKIEAIGENVLLNLALVLEKQCKFLVGLRRLIRHKLLRLRRWGFPSPRSRASWDKCRLQRLLHWRSVSAESSGLGHRSIERCTEHWLVAFFKCRRWTNLVFWCLLHRTVIRTRLAGWSDAGDCALRALLRNAPGDIG